MKGNYWDDVHRKDQVNTFQAFNSKHENIKCTAACTAQTRTMF